MQTDRICTANYGRCDHGAGTSFTTSKAARNFAFKEALQPQQQNDGHQNTSYTMRAELICHFQPCMTEIYLHIDVRMADYIRTHP